MSVKKHAIGKEFMWSSNDKSYSRVQLHSTDNVFPPLFLSLTNLIAITHSVPFLDVAQAF
jgi:hypothetical protein